MGLTINLTDVESGGYDPLPSGAYTVRVTDGELRESGPSAKNPGSQYINWEFTVQDGEYENRRVWTNTSLLPQALFRLKELLGATGRFSDLDGVLDFEIDDVLGAEMRITVIQKPGQDGAPRNEIKRFRLMGSSEASASNLLP